MNIKTLFSLLNKSVWIGNTENVRFRNFVFEGKEINEEQNKKICLNKIDKFWESYPDGLVLFV